MTVREHPILFSAPMVRAILEDRKTQTRRVVKLQHANPLGQWEPTTFGGGGIYTTKGEKVPHQGAIWHTRTGDVIGCPYGQPGQRIWVRESFSGPHEWATIPPSGWGWDHSDVPIWYWADGNPEHGDWTRPRPSIHMPRWASRITLEITDVRVERVQDISEADARAEGVLWVPGHGEIEPADLEEGYSNYLNCREGFQALWDSINESRGFGWNANPYVWALTFRRVEQSQ